MFWRRKILFPCQNSVTILCTIAKQYIKVLVLCYWSLVYFKFLPVVLYGCETWSLTMREERRLREMGRALARMGEKRGVHRVLVVKPEGKRPLGRPRRRWEDNIKMDLQEVGGGCGDWMEFSQDRERWRALVSTVRNFRVP